MIPRKPDLLRRLLLFLPFLYFTLLALYPAHALAEKPAGKPLIHGNSIKPLLRMAAVGTEAIRSDAGFAAHVLDRNDDGSTALVPIGFSIAYGGVSRSSLYVNNNGNVTFDAAMSTYTPFSLNQGGSVMAPFFADVDTRSAGSALVTYGNSVVDGHDAFGMNWVNVGYYGMHDDKLNSFQLVLIDRSDIAAGNFDVEFNYSTINWETGDASGGQDGFGGTSARAGYYDGAGGYLELAGSGVPGALLDGGVNALAASSLDSAQPGRYIFHFRTSSHAALQLLDESRGTAVVGATADGATKVRLRCVSDTPGTVGLVYDRGAADATPNGTFEVAPGSVGGIGNLMLQQVGGHYEAAAIFTVPEGLINEASHDVVFHGTFTAENGQPIPLEDQTLHLQRPPVLLVHGLWSTPATWQDSGVKGALQGAGFTDVRSCDYASSYASHFDYNSGRVMNCILDTLNAMRSRQIAANRIDLVGHSMGGVLARELAHEPGYGKGLIRRLVTLGTPHWGSPWANLLWTEHSDLLNGFAWDLFFRLAQHPIDDGAIEDLQMFSPALLQLGSTPVPSFALIGDINPLDSAETTLIDLLYNAFSFFGVEVAGLDTTSRGSFVNSVMNNEANDLIVPGSSQLGGLSSQYAQRFSPVWHLDETGSPAMGQAVVALLSGGLEAFAAGFPETYTLAAQAQPGPLARAALMAVPVATQTPLITISSPAPEASFYPGDSITIAVAPIDGASIQAVLVHLSDGSDHSALVRQAPFSTTFTIANDFVGVLRYTVAARDSLGRIYVTSGTVTVQSPAAVQSLAVTPSPLVFSSIGTSQELHIVGSFSDGVDRTVSGAGAGTYYAASPSGVVTVSQDGLVTAVGPGSALVTVSNSGVTTQMVAQVSPSQPQVLRVVPATVRTGMGGQTVTLQGLYLGGASSLSFLLGSEPDAQITASDIQLDALGHTVTATLSVGAGAAPGARTVVVTTPGGSSSQEAAAGNLLTVTSALDTTTSLSSAPNPSVLGGQVSLTANVASGSGVPGGSVTFRDGTAILAPPVALDGSGKATLITSALGAGVHNITAEYSGGTGFNPSTSATLVHYVDRLPVADAGPDQALEATSTAGASVSLSGAASFDPDGDPLTFTWSGDFGTASGVAPTVVLPVGRHVITLTVDDGKGGTATDDLKVEVKDTTPPSSTVSLNGNVGANGWYISDVAVTFRATVSAIGLQATLYSLDHGASWNVFQGEAVIVSAEGSTTILYYSTDRAGNREATKSVTVKIDKTPPEARVSMDPVTRDLMVSGVDDLGGVAVTRDASGDFLLADEAGNTTKLFFKRIYSGRILTFAQMTRIQYGSAPVVALPATTFLYVWDVKAKPPVLVSQRIAVNQTYAIEAVYNKRADRTSVLILKHGLGVKKEVFTGFKIVTVTTKKGIVGYAL